MVAHTYRHRQLGTQCGRGQPDGCVRSMATASCSDSTAEKRIAVGLTVNVQPHPDIKYFPATTF